MHSIMNMPAAFNLASDAFQRGHYSLALDVTNAYT